MSQYDPPHAQYSHPVDGRYGAWTDLCIHDGTSVFNQRKAQQEIQQRTCVRRKREEVTDCNVEAFVDN